MNRTNRDRRGMALVALIALALVSLLTSPALPAQDPPTTGPTTAPSTAPADAGPAAPSRNRAWVSGTILGADGKPAASIVVRVEKQEPMGMGGGAGGGKDTGPRTYTANTDENGHFLIKEMYINPYLIIVGNNDVGWIYQDLAVTAGQETKLGTLKLTKIN